MDQPVSPAVWRVDRLANGEQLLSQDDKTIQAGHQTPATATATPSVADTTEDGGARVYPTAQRTPTGPNGHHKEANHSSPRGRYHERTNWADGDVDEDEEDDNAPSEIETPTETPPGANYVKPQNQRQQYERQCLRTVQLTGLADGTTHAELTNAVRGGVLLDIFLRGHERSATISFLHPAEAKQFYDHVRRHDLYIRNKRVRMLERRHGHWRRLLTRCAGRNQVGRAPVYPPGPYCEQGQHGRHPQPGGPRVRQQAHRGRRPRRP